MNNINSVSFSVLCSFLNIKDRFNIQLVCKKFNKLGKKIPFIELISVSENFKHFTFENFHTKYDIGSKKISNISMMDLLKSHSDRLEVSLINCKAMHILDRDRGEFMTLLKYRHEASDLLKDLFQNSILEKLTKNDEKQQFIELLFNVFDAAVTVKKMIFEPERIESSECIQEVYDRSLLKYALQEKSTNLMSIKGIEGGNYDKNREFYEQRMLEIFKSAIEIFKNPECGEMVDTFKIG